MTSRGESRFKDRMPYVETVDGSDWWFCEGMQVMGLSIAGAQAGVRFEEPDKLKDDAAFEDVRPGGTSLKSTSKTWTSTASTYA